MTTGSTPKTLVLLVFVAIYIVLSAYVVTRFAIASNMGDSWRGARLSDMIEGTAERPYVYRVLVPWVISVTDRAMPGFVQEAASNALLSFKDSAILHPFIEDKRNLRQAFEQSELMHVRFSMLLVMTLFFAGYVIALYKLGQALFPKEWAVTLCLPVVGLLMAPALAYPVAYIYDPAVLCLSACCYWALCTQRWRWYYLWFILAVINKETSVFLLLFFSLWYFPKLDAKRFMAHWAAQFIVFVAIRGVIYHSFSDNPGEFLKSDYFSWQIATLLSGFSYTDFIIYSAGIFLLVCGWQEKPLFARYGVIIFLMMIAAFIGFGHPGEYRVFYDVVPLLAVLVTHTLVSCTAVSRAAFFQRQS